MKTLHVNVADKKATFHKADGAIVCGNADYEIEFSFDEDWEKHEKKKARFTVNGIKKDVEFKGETCPVPVVYKVGKIEVGVFVEDELASTDTEIPCVLSCLCKDAKEAGMPPVDLATVTIDATFPPEAPEPYTDFAVTKYEGGKVFSEIVRVNSEIKEIKNVIIGTAIAACTSSANRDSWTYSDNEGMENCACGQGAYGGIVRDAKATITVRY